MGTKAAPELHQAVREASPWIELLARLGYLAKGLVYILIGALAVMPLIGLRGKATNPAGAIDEIRVQPFGAFLLLAIGVGLAGYSIWRLIQAIYNPEHKKLVKRIAYVCSAVAYGTLSFLSLRAISGERASKGQSPDSGQIGLTARLMAEPYGKYLVLALAAILIGIGVAQLVSAAKASFQKTLADELITPNEKHMAVVAGRIGFTSRGIVFLIMGWFLGQAAIDENPRSAKGFAGALKALLAAPYGPYIFAATALGLIAYGVFMLITAKYRRMTTA